MVAYAPLEYGDQVRSYLDALMVHGTFIKGVRAGCRSGRYDIPDGSLHSRDPDPAGVRAVVRHPRQRQPHLEMAIKIAQSAPNNRLIIDHLLKPYIKEGQLEPWHTKMAELAAFPNVYTKISDIATEADLQLDRQGPEAVRQTRPVKLFGEDRRRLRRPLAAHLDRQQAPMRLGANPDRLDHRHRGGFGGQLAKLFGDNARTFYQLHPRAGSVHRSAAVGVGMSQAERLVRSALCASRCSLEPGLATGRCLRIQTGWAGLPVTALPAAGRGGGDLPGCLGRVAQLPALQPAPLAGAQFHRPDPVHRPHRRLGVLDVGAQHWGVGHRRRARVPAGSDNRARAESTRRARARLSARGSARRG